MANKMRSGLSTLGIVIGMASVIVMMSIGQGAESAMMKEMSDIMKNTIQIYPGGGYAKWDRKTQKPGSYIKKIVFDEALIDYIEYNFPELKNKLTFSIRDSGNTKIKKRGRQTQTRFEVSAVDKKRLKLNDIIPIEGMGFAEVHYQKQNFVALVNKKFKKESFDDQSPIGKKISFKNKEFTIIGVVGNREGNEPMRESSIMYIPSTTYMERIQHKRTINEIVVFLDPLEDNGMRKKRLTYLLLKKFNQKNKDDAGFNIHSNDEFAKKIKKSSNIFNYLLLAIGGISLLVGGIGIMNIMIVSVTERTREIGIRKAIGALNKDIVMQFLIESVVMTLIGGILALLLSYGIVFLINKFLGSMGEGGGGFGTMQALINFRVVIVAFSLTTFTGILFGILPARKAAKLKPIDALRFE